MSAVDQLITGNLDIWSSVIKKRGSQGRGSSKKIELYGIKKLRELILELAVRGLLVPQNQNDEPANVLLDKVASEKALLVKNGKIKKQKPLPPIGKDEAPFELPGEWAWVRLESLSHLITKGSSPKWQGVAYTENPEDILFVTSENVGVNCLLLDKKKYVEKHFNEVEPRSILKKGDILMNIVGGSIGRTAVYDIDDLANINQAVCLIRVFGEIIEKEYLLKFFNSETCRGYMFDKQVDNARANLSMGSVSKFVIPLPPIEEQSRVVAKVDELMALCDQLEQQQESSISAHQTLVATLLATLTNAGEKGEFNQAWARIAEHFDSLFTTEHSIDQLKQTILQLAVMGKLVPQDPNDEPAGVLLEKIAAEKAQLLKDKKIKKQKALPPIGEDEKPFELPVGWESAYCQDICYKITDGEHATPKRSDSGHYLLSARNVTNEGILLHDVDFVPTDEFKRIRKRCDPNIGDILISCSGSVGRVALVDRDDSYSMVRSAAMIRPDSKKLHKEFIALLLRSPFLQVQMKKKSKQSAQANLFLGAISSLVMLIPPIEEQLLIVSKVDELFVFCDSLKACIKDSQTTQLHLADAMAEQALPE